MEDGRNENERERAGTSWNGLEWVGMGGRGVRYSRGGPITLTNWCCGVGEGAR